MSTTNNFPINWDTENDNALFGSLFPDGLSTPNFLGNNSSSFEALRTNKSFEDRSNQYAKTNPFGENSLFYTPPLKTESFAIDEKSEKWIFRYHESSKGTELMDLYRKYDESLANSAGKSDDEFDYMIYVETDYRVNLGKVLLIKMSNAMLNYYFEDLIKNKETTLIKAWSTLTFEKIKNKEGFTATIEDLEKAFEIEIQFRAKVNNGAVKFTPSEIASLVSGELSKKIREIKISRERWDPTLNSKKYLFTTFEKAINDITVTLSDFKGDIEAYRKTLEKVNSFSSNTITGKNQLLIDCIAYLTSLENNLTSIIQLFKALKDQGKVFFAFLCGIINGCIEFVCGILDVIFLILEIIFSNALKQEAEFTLDLLQLREGLEEFIEKWLENPNFLHEQIQKMIQSYDYARYKDPKLTVYQVVHNSGEDTILLIDIVISFITIVKAITNSSKYLSKFTEWIDDVVNRNPKISRKIDWLSSGLFKFGNDGETFRNFIKLQQRADDEWYNILCHGEAKRILIDGRKYKAEEFAEKLLNEGYEKGKPIRLISCYTGSKPNGFASQLAKILETKVIAPTEKIGVDDFGEFVHRNKGKFVEFNK